jgi:hypothetical protein
MGALSTILSPLLPRQTRIVRNSWKTASTCCKAAWMWPPTLPNMSALSWTHQPLIYPSSQLQPSASSMRGTSIMTGLLLVLLRLMMPNCKQSQMGFVRLTLSVWRTYARCTSSLTLQTCSTLAWTCFITQDSTHPSPFVKCWCLGSNTIQIIPSTSPMVWIWRCKGNPHFHHHYRSPTIPTPSATSSHAHHCHS